MSEPLSFRLWLRQRRKMLDLTKEDLADCAACSVTTIEKLEFGERRPSKQLAELLARCLKIAPEEMASFVVFARERTG